MAQQIANGIQKTADPRDDHDFSPSEMSIAVILAPIGNVTFVQVLEANAVILGSSVENGNTHPLLHHWINDEWDIRRSDELSTKVGAAFVTAGGISAGQESTLQSLLRSMLTFQMIVVGGDYWQAAYGAAAITGEAPFQPLRDGEDIGPNYFARECYEEPRERIIHPLFLDKAYGLGARVASVVQRLGKRCNC